MTKTMSIRMDRENFDFLSEFTKEQRSDFSKAVRDLVTRGRILLAVERYKQGEASLGRAAELAGVSLGQMMTILSRIRSGKQDPRRGLSPGPGKSAKGVVTTGRLSRVCQKSCQGRTHAFELISLHRLEI